MEKVLLTRERLELMEENVEELCFSSRKTIFEDGKAVADARLAALAGATG